LTGTSHDNGLRDTLHGVVAAALISAVAVSIPIIGFFALLLLPQPFIFYRLKLGRKQSVIIMGAALLMLFLIIGQLFADVVFLLGMMGLGVFMGEFIERGCRVEQVVAYACGAIFSAGLILLFVYAAGLEMGVRELAADYIARNLEKTLELYEKIGMSEASIQMLERSKGEITGILLRLSPALTATGLLFAGWINLLVGRRLLRRWQDRGELFEDLNLWRAPEWLVWAVIAGIVLILIPDSVARFFGANALVVLMLVYFFQGIAVVAFYFEKKQVPQPFRWLIYAFIGIQQILLLVVVAIGFCDVWANFRRLQTPPDTPDAGP